MTDEVPGLTEEMVGRKNIGQWDICYSSKDAFYLKLQKKTTTIN